MTWPYFNGVVKFEKLLLSLERLEFIILLSSVIGLGGVGNMSWMVLESYLRMFVKANST
jgi:hypothetical protein